MRFVGGSRTVGQMAFLLALSAFVFVMIEGCSSVLVSLHLLGGEDRPLTLSNYDPELGWVSPPLLALDDAWGRGRSLRTNSRGFRGSEEFSAAPGTGRIRVVCSGDSFTYGQGVGDDSTWCRRLAHLDERLETINLGIPGYGVDQAFLRYRRDAVALGEELHLFAFIGRDLARAGRSDHHGFEKPRLRLEDGQLTVTNVPVPRWRPAVRRWLRDFSERLQSVPLARAVMSLLVGGVPSNVEQQREALRPVLSALFREVASLSQARGSQALFIYLPVEAELESDGPWRRWVHEELGRLGYPFIDLTESIRSVPSASSLEYFIPQGAAAQGHYTAQGNAWAARAIHEALLQLRGPSLRVVGSNATS